MTETTSATLRHAGGELELPRIQVVEGNEGYDVSKLLKQTGAVAFDPGFMNTAATTSAITYIDGDAGILRYRGYPIEQLAQHSSFLEVSYLLIYGNLPTPAELESFDQRIRHHTLLRCHHGLAPASACTGPACHAWAVGSDRESATRRPGTRSGG